MITAFRRYLDTWVVRGFFLIMVGSFVLWGMGDVIRGVGTTTWVAKVDGDTIETQTFQAEFTRAMALAGRNLPNGQEPTPEMRRQVGDETLQRMIGQTVLTHELHDLRIITPDPAVREAVMAIPAFRGTDGSFNRQVFETVLRNNGLNEPRFLDMMRNDIAQRQLLGAVTAGAAAPDTETLPIYQQEFEKRSAEIAEFPIAAAPAPPTPDEAVLQRWYDNHPDSYSTPEYRKVKVVELSPQSLAKDIPITDADLHAAYDAQKSEYVTTGTRTAQVITAPDEAKAQALATKWRDGADWNAMQAAAKTDGATAVELDGATETMIPDRDLARAVFAAAADTVSAPIKGQLGWFVAKVTKIVPGKTRSFDEVKDELRDKVLADKASDLIYDRANKLDNLLGNGTPFDELPGDLGLAGLSGTLDAQGNTQDGTPAPIPGAPELRQAIITAAFQTQKGEPPRLVEVQTPSTGGSSYYALEVEDVIPPGKKPFDEVKQKVEEDWTADQQRHEAETQAAKMLTAIKGGQSFADAATVAGVPVRRTPLVTRGQGADGMPPELQRVLFGLKPKEPTMVETAEAFLVAEPAEIVEPDPKADAGGLAQARQAVKRSVAADLASVFTEALRQRASVSINQKNFDSVVQP
ncbi:MAG: peptidyl-prolyl cis-trans isomerase [Rhodospirillales bacterium]|nr:peptidyl-prolyl cis-trans isomerase [Rhodospirillales bacterium]